jgi:hypothetical protein
MSYWTQVLAAFRCGGTKIGERFGTDWEEALGKVLKWESRFETWDDYERHPELYTPTGSEGGIEWHVFDDDQKDSYFADRYKVVAYGSLRDFTDLQKIRRWFKACCNNLTARQAVLEASNDMGQRIVMTLADVE